MKKLRLIKLLIFALILFTSTSVIAQGGRVGEKVPEFQLQGTDGKFYGIKYADNSVSVICIVGYS
ncbi:MAG: hypothetical protein QGG64_29935 [Candidatus Latescibacteria bacterium]|nr:hypothetical protein [Candidatus Latescibacterota bacterium]